MKFRVIYCGSFGDDCPLAPPFCTVGKERKLYVPNTTNAMNVNFNNGNVNNNNKTNNNYVRCVRAGA